MQGSPWSCCARTFRFSDRGLLLRFRLGLGRWVSSPAGMQPPPAPPVPGPRRCPGKVVLLTSFFTSVRSSSVRDGAVGSMVKAGDGASSGCGSSGCAAPPRLGDSASGWKGRRGGGEGREEEGYAFENRWTRGSNCSASGSAFGSRGLSRPKLPDAEIRFPLLPSPRGPGPGTAPRWGRAFGRARPVSVGANRDQPMGQPSPRPPAGAFQEWLRPQPPGHLHVAAGWPHRKASFPWLGSVAVLPAGRRRLRRQLTGGVESLLVCTLGFLLFSQTLPNDFLLLCLPTQVLKLFGLTRTHAHTQDAYTAYQQY